MQWWSLLALADLFVINRPHTYNAHKLNDTRCTYVFVCVSLPLCNLCVLVWGWGCGCVCACVTLDIVPNKALSLSLSLSLVTSDKTMICFDVF